MLEGAFDYKRRHVVYELLVCIFYFLCIVENRVLAEVKPFKRFSLRDFDDFTYLF